MPKTQLRKVGQRLIRDDVLSSLRTAILDGTFQPGDHLTETELAEQLGTSRGPVRDALKELAQEGLVDIAPYRGAVVATLTASDIREIYELRALLEGYAAKLATERVTAVDIDRLQSIFDEMQALADGDELSTFVQKDMEFHREICRLSGNQRLLKVWNSLAAQVRLLAILAHHLFLEPRIIVETHIETLKAMESRDSGWVEKVVKEKILMVGQAITQALEEREPVEM